MKFTMKLSRVDVVGPELHEHRDAIGARNVSDLLDDPRFADALRRWAEASVASLDRKAKKAGFQPAESGFEYGIHGGKTGPVTFWLQRRFAE